MPRESSQRDANEVRINLRIDEDDLDRCLIAQPEYFYQAAMASTAANSTRDFLELELKELSAQLDGDIRAEFTSLETKYSEASIANQLRTLPRIKEKQRACLAARKAADEAQALKEAYIQRSYALKDLSANQRSRLTDLGIDGGSGGNTRRAAADRISDRVDATRLGRDRQQRGRYRPQDQGD
jgi:hypothetical protein